MTAMFTMNIFWATRHIWSGTRPEGTTCRTTMHPARCRQNSRARPQSYQARSASDTRPTACPAFETGRNMVRTSRKPPKRNLPEPSRQDIHSRLHTHSEMWTIAKYMWSGISCPNAFSGRSSLRMLGQTAHSSFVVCLKGKRVLCVCFLAGTLLCSYYSNLCCEFILHYVRTTYFRCPSPWGMARCVQYVHVHHLWRTPCWVRRHGTKLTTCSGLR